MGRRWGSEPLRALIGGMLSALNTLNRSPSAHRVLCLARTGDFPSTTPSPRGRQVDPTVFTPEHGLVAWLIGDPGALDGPEPLGERREDFVVEGLLLAT